MYQEGIRLIATRASNLVVDCDRLSTLATRDGATIEVTRSLLAASWSVRAANFALQLAIKQMESNGTLGPSPSSRSATGG